MGPRSSSGAQPGWQKGTAWAAHNPARQGRTKTVPSAQHPPDPTQALPLLWVPVTRMGFDKLVRGEERPPRRWGGRSFSARRGCRTGAGLAGKRNSLRGTQQQPNRAWRRCNPALGIGEIQTVYKEERFSLQGQPISGAQVVSVWPWR